MRIGIDLDGVLADFNTPFIALVEKHTGIKLPAPSATYPDVWDFHIAGGVTKAQASAMWEDIKTSYFWAKQQPVPGALEALKLVNALAQEPYFWNVYFITSRHGERAKWMAEAWLCMAGIDNPTVLIAHQKGGVVGGLELDAFIDDKPENIRDAYNGTADGNIHLFLVDAPYNRRAHAACLATIPFARVKSVLEAVQLLHQPVARTTSQEAA
jgi:uncharacterized HAD superfamily protein